jgi:tetratricopeptide (TPR) repeat protein
VSRPARVCSQGFSRLTWVGLTLFVAGCPKPVLPPIKSGATVRESELPKDPAGLIRFIDDEIGKDTAVSNQNALVAVDQLLTSDSKNYDALWRGAKACARLAEEYYSDKNRRAQFADKGTSYAKKAVAVDNKRVEGQYYRGINMGLLSTTKTVGAYLMVSKVVKAAQAAARANELFDHAGPVRLLGQIYVKAPPWPASVGDLDEGLKHLKRSVELAPEYPQNHLFYGDALYADASYDEAAAEYRRVLDTPPKPEYVERLVRWKEAAQTGLEKIAKKRGGGKATSH